MLSDLMTTEKIEKKTTICRRNSYPGPLLLFSEKSNRMELITLTIALFEYTCLRSQNFQSSLFWHLSESWPEEGSSMAV